LSIINAVIDNENIIKVWKNRTISMATFIFFDALVICLGPMVYMLNVSSSSPVNDAKRYDEATA
jgi:hypothetical protein